MADDVPTMELTIDALGAEGDVGAVLPARKVDRADELVGGSPCPGQVRAGRGHGQHPTAGGDDRSVVTSTRPGVDHAGLFGAGDDRAYLRGVRIAGRCHDNSHRRRIAPLQRRMLRQRAIRRCGQQPRQRRLEQREHDLRLGIAEPRVELDHPGAV